MRKVRELRPHVLDLAGTQLGRRNPSRSIDDRDHRLVSPVVRPADPDLTRLARSPLESLCDVAKTWLRRFIQDLEGSRFAARVLEPAFVVFGDPENVPDRWRI